MVIKRVGNYSCNGGSMFKWDKEIVLILTCSRKVKIQFKQLGDGFLKSKIVLKRLSKKHTLMDSKTLCFSDV